MAKRIEWKGKSESDFFLWCTNKILNHYFMFPPREEWYFNPRDHHGHMIHLRLGRLEWARIIAAAQNDIKWRGTEENFIRWCVDKVLHELDDINYAISELVENPESVATFNEGEDAELKDDGTIQISSDILNAIGAAPGAARVHISNGAIVIEPSSYDAKRWGENGCF